MSRGCIGAVLWFLASGGPAAGAVEWMTTLWTSPDVSATGTWRADFDDGAPQLATGRYAWHASETGAAVEFAFEGTAA